VKFRHQLLLFAVVTVTGGLVLWMLPGPTITISYEGRTTTNGYWWWLAGGFLVAVVCAAEYLWTVGSAHIAGLSPRQKSAVGVFLIAVAVVATCIGVLRYYR
jgi:hypothetical protein